VCGSGVNVFSDPACDVDACDSPWPKGLAVHRFMRTLCVGDNVTLQILMDLCCVSTADKMRAMLDAAIAPVPRPARVYGERRMPNVRPFNNERIDVDDSIFNF
ncbi:hypothetical protein PFISCL1PPCAC_28224, partial [Pristionchus fissidentatus]